jgi:hypothetical protein
MKDTALICEGNEGKGMSLESSRIIEKYCNREFDTCPSWLKKKYRQATKFCCQECGKHEDIVGKLEPHRIIRGNKGGKYTVVPLNHPGNNVKEVCSSCHRKFHQKDNSKVGYR